MSDLSLHLGLREVSGPLGSIRVTRQQASLLRRLGAKPKSLVPIDLLIAAMHDDPDDEPDEPRKALCVQMAHLRKKLAVAGVKNVIGNVYGEGYVLTVPCAVQK